MNESGNDSAPTANGGAGEIVVRVFGRTDVGLVREHNEDNFLIADLSLGNRSIKPEVRTHSIGPKGSLFSVCDGMGGAAAGEVASRIAVDTIYELMQGREVSNNDQELARGLDEAIHEAGTRIHTAARLNRGQRGMGTTVTAAVLCGSRMLVGQVGDSRALVVRNGRLVQVTKDQSLVQQLIDAKQLTEEEARSFDKSNIILQALGTTEEVHVDMTSVELRRGDALVLCSDGLSGLVEPEAIRDAVLEIEDPMEACRKLTDLACAEGGDDNITVIVARFDGDGLPEPSPDNRLGYERFEYPRVGEITVRSGYPRDPAATDDRPSDVSTGEQAKKHGQAASGQSRAQSEVRDAAAGGTGAENEASPRESGGEIAQGAPAHVKPEEAGPAESTDETVDEASVQVDKSRTGPVIGVLAVIGLGAVLGGYLMFGRGPDGESTNALTGTQPATTQPIEPDRVPVDPPGTTETPQASGTAMSDAPPLSPTDERDIVGNGAPSSATPGTDSATGAGAEKPAMGQNKTSGSKKKSPTDEQESPPPASGGDETGKSPEADSGSKSKPGASITKKAEKKKKTGKGKKQQSVIPENPFD